MPSTRTRIIRVTALAAIAVLAGVGGGVAMVAMTARAGRDQREQPASMAQVSASEPAGASSAPPTAATAAPSTAAPSTAAPSTASESAAPRAGDTVALAACADAAGRGDRAVAAAGTALDNWRTHYGAQLAYDRGDIDSAEAKRRWAASKAPAQRNVDAFVAARRSMPDGRPCGGVDTAGLGATRRAEVRVCAGRLRAADDVVRAAAPAMRDWRGHLRMMAHKDDYAIDEYLAIWARTVAGASGPMARFDRAVAAYHRTGRCELAV